MKKLLPSTLAPLVQQILDEQAAEQFEHEFETPAAKVERFVKTASWQMIGAPRPFGWTLGDKYNLLTKDKTNGRRK